MRVTRRRFLVVGAALVGPVLAACGGAASPTAAPGGAPSAGAKPPPESKPAAAEPTKPSGPPAAPPAAPTNTPAPAAASGPPSAPTKPAAEPTQPGAPPAAVKMDDFYPGVLDDARGFGGDGKLFCLPTIMHAGGNIVVAFNVDLLEKAGLKMPTKDWTVQQYEEIARKSADPKNGIFGTHINMSAPLYAAQAIRSWSSNPQKSSEDSW